MSILNSIFDVIRGYPDESVIEVDFRPHSSVPAQAPLTEGDVVVLMGDGTVARATGADLAAAATVADLAAAIAEQKQLWLIVSGNSPQESDGLTWGIQGSAVSHVPWKVVAIKGTYMYETAKFVVRAYTPGQTVTVVNGEVDLVDAANAVNAGFQAYGEVHSYDAVAGKLTITVEK